ncbi:MAG TPA: hypothetical protein VFV19_02270 [Candidatus Polarisedimenticolaceae bacterium]|nr:hypothetical protein [Candidatus Polarisedimenticolaceae bacterium]
MKRPQAIFRSLGVFLLLVATTVGISRSVSPDTTDDKAALLAQVKDLESQLETCNQQITRLRAENDSLRGVLSEVVAKQARETPKNFVPYDYNGMRFYVGPAMPGHEVPSK